MMRLPAFCFFLMILGCSGVPAGGEGTGLGNQVLHAISSMPEGGGYDGSDATKNLLPGACSIRDGKLAINAERARPSFCSSATYLVFLRAISPHLDETATKALIPVMDQQDGEGVFGRWNANGPGCAKLVADLGAGVNFTDWNQAQPGDFLKIWWTDEIGGNERGHHVVYLGHDAKSVKFWSSNQPGGYGTKTVPLADCRRVLFTRITKPGNFARAASLPERDEWLARMLKEDFSWDEVKAQCRIR